MLIVSLCSAAGCATPGALYTVGTDGQRQDRESAERAQTDHAVHFSATEQYDTPPKLLSSRLPDYPEAWRRSGIVGTVVVKFTIGPNGSVSDPSVVGAPPAQLAALSLGCIMLWKFSPASKNGVPVQTRAQQSFTFKLE